MRAFYIRMPPAFPALLSCRHYSLIGTQVDDPVCFGDDIQVVFDNVDSNLCLYVLIIGWTFDLPTTWDCLLDAMAKSGGSPIGLSALKSIVCPVAYSVVSVPRRAR